METLSQHNIEILYISRFSAKFLFCPGFLSYWDKFQAISKPGQIKFKSPDFPAFQVPLGTLYGHFCDCLFALKDF